MLFNEKTTYTSRSTGPNVLEARSSPVIMREYYDRSSKIEGLAVKFFMITFSGMMPGQHHKRMTKWLSSARNATHSLNLRLGDGWSHSLPTGPIHSLQPPTHLVFLWSTLAFLHPCLTSLPRPHGSWLKVLIASPRSLSVSPLCLWSSVPCRQLWSSSLACSTHPRKPTIMISKILLVMVTQMVALTCFQLHSEIFGALASSWFPAYS